jgi:hypothetical protein
MIKIRSKFKLCGEDIISKFDHLIAPYGFISVFNQTIFSFLTAHNSQQLFSQLIPHNNVFHSHNQTKQTLTMSWFFYETSGTANLITK